MAAFEPWQRISIKGKAMATAVDRIALSLVSSSLTFEVVGFDLPEGDMTRLKVLGICEGHDIRLIQLGSPMILEVFGSSIGISRRLAHGIFIQPK